MAEKNASEVEADEIAFFADYYANQASNPTGWRLRLEREIRSLRQKSDGKRLGKVLSVGCGDGQFEVMLAPFTESVTALDISPEAIAIAKASALRADVKNVDFRCLSLAGLNWEESYDTIICLAFLHHIRPSELREFFQQVYRHLAPDGLFYAEDPNIHGVLRKISSMVARDAVDRFHTPDERELDPSEISSLMREVGFRSVRIGYIDLTLIPTLFVLRKGPDWCMYVCTWVDWLWCHSPLARWASGFTTFAQK